MLKRLNRAGWPLAAALAIAATGATTPAAAPAHSATTEWSKSTPTAAAWSRWRVR